MDVSVSLLLIYTSNNVLIGFWDVEDSLYRTHVTMVEKCSRCLDGVKKKNNLPTFDSQVHFCRDVFFVFFSRNLEKHSCLTTFYLSLVHVFWHFYLTADFLLGYWLSVFGLCTLAVGALCSQSCGCFSCYSSQCSSSFSGFHLLSLNVTVSSRVSAHLRDARRRFTSSVSLFFFFFFFSMWTKPSSSAWHSRKL